MCKLFPNEGISLPPHVSGMKLAQKEVLSSAGKMSILSTMKQAETPNNLEYIWKSALLDWRSCFGH